MVNLQGQPLRILHVEAALSPDGKECRVVLVDVTEQQRAQDERRILEAELLQSQKLESLGSLAGGMAHDMNNVLGAILGLASTLRVTAEPESVEARRLDTIVAACLRGREVGKSLLYFARKDLGEDRPLDLNNLATELARLLDATTLKRIRLDMDLQAGLPHVHGDPGALNNALMNLCVNAIDAMPHGGTLSLQTRLRPDGALEMRVRDSGSGMSEETLARAIDPFFTTKPVGKGTGLGLPMVYGTMRAHDGTLDLQSRLGEGTEVTLLFPVSRIVPEGDPPETPSALPEGGLQALNILVVDDDVLIRESVAAQLESMGHRAVLAHSGARALRFLEDGLPVDLVLLDMNMPEMDGAQALPRILALRPGLPVLIDTGHSDEAIRPLLAGRPTVGMILKPFTLNELRAKLAELRSRTSETGA